MNKYIDMIWERFGRLLVLKRVGNSARGLARFLCLCDCGKKIEATGSDLRRGKHISCGCTRLKHGMIESGVYRTWAGMKNRCLSKSSRNYKDYGGRGIKVCDEWLKFENFYRDMGGKPKGKSLDRIDNNGNYCKTNCRWADMGEQQNNRRDNRMVCINGELMTLSQWSRVGGIKADTIRRRLNRNWSIEDALFKKPFTKGGK